jgi:hypothetical protein
MAHAATTGVGYGTLDEPRRREMRERVLGRENNSGDDERWRMWSMKEAIR